MASIIDRHRIDIKCEKCHFWCRPFLRQVRLGETIICGGCKANVRLIDHLGSVRKVERQMDQQLEELTRSLKGLNFTIRI